MIKFFVIFLCLGALLITVSCTSGGGNFLRGKQCSLKDGIEVDVKADKKYPEGQEKTHNKAAFDLKSLPAGDYEYNGADLYVESVDKKIDYRLYAVDAKKVDKKTKEESFEGDIRCVRNDKAGDDSIAYDLAVGGVQSLTVTETKGNPKSSGALKEKTFRLYDKGGDKDLIQFEFSGDIKSGHTKPGEVYKARNQKVFLYNNIKSPNHYQIRSEKTENGFKISLLVHLIRKDLKPAKKDPEKEEAKEEETKEN